MKSNEGGEHLVTISGTSLSLTHMPGLSGSLTCNSPWSGLLAYQIPASGVTAASGVMMAAGSEAFTSISNDDPALFVLGFKIR